MTKKQEKKKNVLNKNDFDIGIYTFEDLYTLLSLTAFFVKKYKVDNIVNFYKKVYPDSSFIHIEYYEKINIIEEIEERNLLPEKEIEIYMDKIEEQNINENIEEEASKWTKENWLENFERINYVYKSVADIITEKLINENWKNEEEIKEEVQLVQYIGFVGGGE